jgi:guanine deaminase
VAELTIPDGTLIQDHGGAYLFPGFVDCHIHYPQVWSQDCYGGGELLEWLERCIFPAEARLSNPALAREAARDFCDALIRAGTTCSFIFGSQFPAAQEALFEELRSRGMRAIAGRTVQVRGPPAAQPLCTSETDAIRLCREELERWHPAKAEVDRALVRVALIPRFALSLTIEGLRLLGELFDSVKDRGVFFSTHLAENARPGDGEVEKVIETFRVKSYLDTYDGLFLPGSRRGGNSFLGPRSIFAHAVHCTDGELSRLARAHSRIAHCPVSQLFLGSGTMPWRRIRAAKVKLGVGTDAGAGDTFSVPDVLNACFKVHMSEPHPSSLALHPAQLLHLGTLGGAQTLSLDHRIGNFDPGKDADFLVVTASDDPLLARRLEACESKEARLFALLMGFSRASIRHVFVRGREVVCSSAGQAGGT